MRIHHLNCGTLRPLGRRLINGDGLPFQPGRLVCHCLLVETDRSLVLVDSGFGLGDIARYRGGPAPVDPNESPKLRRARRNQARFMTRARLDPEETAVRQAGRLGFAADDVTDVVLTHLDSDHAGGLPDFPRARVHTREAEHRAAMSPQTPIERFRYRAYHWGHDPEWVLYGSSGGDTWFDFEDVRELEGLPELAFVPLPGHTRGQAGVAIRLSGGDRPKWLLHAGDAYFFHGEIDPASPHCTPGLAYFQGRTEIDAGARRDSRARLRQLVAAHADEVEIFCSHDPVEFDRYVGSAARAV